MVQVNLIYNFSKYDVDINKRNEKRWFTIQFTDDEINFLKTTENFSPILQNKISNLFIIEIDFNITTGWDQIKIKAFLEEEQKTIDLSGGLFTYNNNRQIIKSIFSDVEINFTPNNINSVTSNELDKKISYSLKSNINLATEITQLLVDIQSLDALDFSEWARKNPDEKIDHSKLDTRINRFTNAFNQMFPNKVYKNIRNIDSRKRIIFEEHGKEMFIEELSSGEKQIVFRGGFLLKDQKSIGNSIVLIDEPEISLHPRWQMKILDFFKNILRDSKGNQSSQMFVATHSPFIIHNYHRNNDKVIILAKDANGKISVEYDSKYYGWTEEVTIQKAFKTDFISSILKPIVFVEGETDEIYLAKTMEVFGYDRNLFEIKWIGRINKDGNVEFTGDTALNQARLFLTINNIILKQKVLFLYDSDTNKPEEIDGNVITMKMNKNPLNTTYKIGIENLLNLPNDFPYINFYTEKEKQNNYGAVSIIRELNKMKLCDYICSELGFEKQKEYLDGFSVLLDRIAIALKSS